MRLYDRVPRHRTRWTWMYRYQVFFYSKLLQNPEVYLRTYPANIRLDEDVLKTSWRRLDQDEYVRLSLTSSEDVFKTSSRRPGQDQYIRPGHTSSRRLQDVFKINKCLLGILHKKWRIWSYLLKKTLMENFIFCAVLPNIYEGNFLKTN